MVYYNIFIIFLKLVKRKILELAKQQGDVVTINSILIDFYLWDKAKEDRDKIAHVPIHKTVTIYY